MSEEAKRYLSQNDLPQIVENLTAMLIKDMPEKPVNAMAQWLLTQGGIDTDAYNLKTKARVAKAAPMPVEIEAGKTYYWCTCGASKKQPFCDGSHAKLNKAAGTNFAPSAFEAKESKTAYFCACKNTKNPPMCDGSHAKLSLVQLYIFPISPNCMAVEALIKDTNIPAEIIPVTPGDHKKEPFLAKFPLGAVPTLTDGTFHTFESCSILRYLCNKYKLGSPYYPSDPILRNKVDRMLDWRQTSFYPPLSEFVYPALKWKTNEPAVIAANREKFTGHCNLFTSKLLEGKPFVAGDKPSIADYSIAFSLIMLAAVPDYKLPADMQAYFDRFRAASMHAEDVIAPFTGFLATLK